MQQILMPHMARGLLRLEGFVQRLQPEAVSDSSILFLHPLEKL
jgi:hypothetical protein